MGYLILYLLFNVGLPTYVRLLDGNDGNFTRKDWLITMIPGLGLLYAIFLVFKLAWK
jgi:amino acid transporter